MDVSGVDQDRELSMGRDQRGVLPPLELKNQPTINKKHCKSAFTGEKQINSLWLLFLERGCFPTEIMGGIAGLLEMLTLGINI